MTTDYMYNKLLSNNCFILSAAAIKLTINNNGCPDGFNATYTTSAGIIEWTDLNTMKSVRFNTSDQVGKNSTFGVFTAVLINITDNSSLTSTIMANTALPVDSPRTIEYSNGMGYPSTLVVRLLALHETSLLAAESIGPPQAEMTAVNLTWYNPDQCVTSYDVEVTTSNSTFTLHTENQSIVVMLEPDSNCSFRVRPLAGHVKGIWSEAFNFTINGKIDIAFCILCSEILYCSNHCVCEV